MATPKRSKDDADLKAANQLQADASLEVASSKEKLKKRVDRETKSVDKAFEVNTELNKSKTQLNKSIKNEKDSINLEADSALEMAVAREKVTRALGHLKDSLTDQIKQTKKATPKAPVSRKKSEIKQDLEQQAPVIDFSSQLDKLNKTLADFVKALKDKPKAEKPSGAPSGPPKPETPTGDTPTGDTPTSDEGKPEVKTAAEYKKAAQKEIDKQLGFMRRMSKSLNEVAKESESGMKRMSANLLLGAGRSISSSLDKFVSSIPVVGGAYDAGKFVRKNFREAGDTKRKRLVKERASEMKASDQQKLKDWKANKPSNSGGDGTSKPPTDSGEESRDKEQMSLTEKMISVLNEIRDSQLMMALFNMGGGLMNLMSGFAGKITSGIGGALTAALSGLGLGGLKKAIDAITGGKFGKTEKASKSTKTPDAPDKSKKPEAGKPKDAPKTPDGKGKGAGAGKPSGGGVIDKAKGGLKRVLKSGGVRVAGKMAARFVPFLGTALMAYEVADSLGLVDLAKEKYNEYVATAGSVEALAEQEERAEKSLGSGSYGHEMPKPQPGYPLVDQSQIKYNSAGETVERGAPQAYAQAQLEAAGQVTPSTEIEKWTDRVNEVNRQREESYKVNLERMIQMNSANARTNVSSVSSVTNNNTTSINFNTSEYQTSYQKGSQVIR